jgi:serine/threonine protein kinase
VCEGLRFCHEGCGGAFRGSHRVLLHRDLKPENVLLRRHGDTGEMVAALGDFGISKLYPASGQATVNIIGTIGCVLPPSLSLSPYLSLPLSP